MKEILSDRRSLMLFVGTLSLVLLTVAMLMMAVIGADGGPLRFGSKSL